MTRAKSTRKIPTMSSQSTADLEAMVTADLAQHKETDNCDCPLKCPTGCGLAHWDMGLEGHYCSKCEWYDGVK